MNFKILVYKYFFAANKFTFVLLLSFVFLGSKSMAQENQRDSIWLTIVTTNKDSFITKTPKGGYQLLYKKPFRVPKIQAIPSGFAVQKLLPDLKTIIQQFGLEKSYTVSAIKNTDFEKVLYNASYLSYPFSEVLTTQLATAIDIPSSRPKYVAFQETIQTLQKIDSTVMTTAKMVSIIQKDYQTALKKNVYLRKRLLDLLVGNYNQKPENQYWIQQNSTIFPYIKNNQNQYMDFDGTYKIVSKLLPAYKHFESYNNQIKNIKKVTAQTLGFDVNLLSTLPYEVWEQEVHFIQEKLTEDAVMQIQKMLPNTATIIAKTLFKRLSSRIDNLSQLAKKYYQLVSKNKIVYASNADDKIEVVRKKESTQVLFYSLKISGEIPQKKVTFLNKNTSKIWIYTLMGADYIADSGTGKTSIPIAIIGGKGNDTYVLKNGKNSTIYDDKSQTHLIETGKAKVKLANHSKFTKTNIKKYSHTQNTITPLFGANPDDGIFIGASNTFLVQNFNRNPFSQKHEFTGIINLGYLGFDVNYYGEIATVSNHFNVFTQLGYQSPNYATNFFGFGNETPNLESNLKLDYNRVRIATFDAKMGVVKDEKQYVARANLFFNSYQIEATENRFITSKTLFFPEEDFYKRKNYAGAALSYMHKKMAIPFFTELKLQPSINMKANVNVSNFKNSLVFINPNILITHPLYGDAVTIDATFDYTAIIGSDTPFYLAANIGGNSGLRGYRNQRFTGQSSWYSSTNVKWKAKDVQSDVLPLQIGVFAGFDAGRVEVKEEQSNVIHTSIGGGIWLQSANLMKVQLQVFGFDEGARLSFNLVFGL